jgi:PncC family amidohydrolase
MFSAERSALLEQASRSLARQLRRRGLKLVLAESCTAGLVAASLAAHPGISDNLCGAAVTYRNDTKRRWLGVAQDALTDPGPVSAEVTAQMVRGVLWTTPEADWGAAITGHLGPDAPAALDGQLFLAAGSTAGEVEVVSRRLEQPLSRTERQCLAAVWLLEFMAAKLES